MRKRVSVLILLGLVVGCGRGLEPNSSRRLIRVRGSDTMVIAAVAWAERYHEIRPEAGVAVTGGGSGAGIAALINGTVEIANTSRRMRSDELASSQARGLLPAMHIVGYDAPAIVVHPANPLSSISFAQLAEIYGEGGAADHWSDLGTAVPGCSDDEIVRVSRQESSGTFEYLRRRILGAHRDYKLGSRDMQGSQDVVSLVAATPCAIGYTGLAYAPPANVKMPCLSATAEGACVVPSMQSAVDGSYPIARPLMIYTRSDPTQEVSDYVLWVLSDAGQCILQEAGYAPVRPVACDPP